jgi:hypothetical protein
VEWLEAMALSPLDIIGDPPTVSFRVALFEIAAQSDDVVMGRPVYLFLPWRLVFPNKPPDSAVFVLITEQSFRLLRGPVGVRDDDTTTYSVFFGEIRHLTSVLKKIGDSFDFVFRWREYRMNRALIKILFRGLTGCSKAFNNADGPWIGPLGGPAVRTFTTTTAMLAKFEVGRFTVFMSRTITEPLNPPCPTFWMGVTFTWNQ